jgi:hypothetical protein
MSTIFFPLRNIRPLLETDSRLLIAYVEAIEAEAEKDASLANVARRVRADALLLCDVPVDQCAPTSLLPTLLGADAYLVILSDAIQANEQPLLSQQRVCADEKALLKQYAQAVALVAAVNKGDDAVAQMAQRVAHDTDAMVKQRTRQYTPTAMIPTLLAAQGYAIALRNVPGRTRPL